MKTLTALICAACTALAAEVLPLEEYEKMSVDDLLNRFRRKELAETAAEVDAILKGGGAPLLVRAEFACELLAKEDAAYRPLLDRFAAGSVAFPVEWFDRMPGIYPAPGPEIPRRHEPYSRDARR